MPTENLDRRVNAYRDDLADARLEGCVEAKRFTEGTLAQVLPSVLPMRKGPAPEQERINEALCGERVRVFDWGSPDQRGWAWIQLERDGYVGYVPATALTTSVVQTTHRVTAPATWSYAAPDIKSPAPMHYSLGSEVAVRRADERFAELASGSFIVTRHLTERSRPSSDFVEVAERFIGTPYLWGGRSRLGIDCSGLLQLCLEVAGIAAPRDSDMQLKALGTDVLIPHDLDGLDRGDLVFWPGHVAIMVDGVMMVHANAHHMAVVVEPLMSAAARIKAAGSEIRAVKRLPALGRTA